MTDLVEQRTHASWIAFAVLIHAANSCGQVAIGQAQAIGRAIATFEDMLNEFSEAGARVVHSHTSPPVRKFGTAFSHYIRDFSTSCVSAASHFLRPPQKV